MHRVQTDQKVKIIFYYILIYFSIRALLIYFLFLSACCTGYWLVTKIIHHSIVNRNGNILVSIRIPKCAILDIVSVNKLIFYFVGDIPICKLMEAYQCVWPKWGR